MSNQGEVEMHSVDGWRIWNSRQARVHQDSSLFRVSLLPLLPLPPKEKKNLKPAVSATNVQSAHSANKWKNKKTFLLLSSFFLAAKFKKKKRPSSLVFIVPKWKDEEKPTKRRVSPKNRCVTDLDQRASPSGMCNQSMFTVSHLLQVHCGILPRTGSCQCCLVWV